MIIKGRYVCQIEVNFEYDEDELNIEYGKLYDKFMSDWMERTVQKQVEEIFEGGNLEIIVTRQYADIVRKEEEE